MSTVSKKIADRVVAGEYPEDEWVRQKRSRPQSKSKPDSRFFTVNHSLN